MTTTLLMFAPCSGRHRPAGVHGLHVDVGRLPGPGAGVRRVLPHLRSLGQGRAHPRRHQVSDATR